MNGNITKDGIQKDLDWMERIGIGGFHNFDANLFTPVVVPKKLVFMTPEWKDTLKFTTELADKKGLEMAIAGSPGWSVTGGPWVKPQDGMKKYVWTETRVEGGKTFSGKLPQPSDVIGKFQNTKITEGGVSGDYVGKKPTFYQDALVFAYRLLKNDVVFADLKPTVTSSGGSFNVKDLTDGDLAKTSFLPPKAIGEDAWIQYAFDAPQTFKAFSVMGALHSPLEEFQGSPENRTLKVSDDGINFKDTLVLFGNKGIHNGSAVPQITVSFAPITAKYWRLSYKTLPPPFNPFAALGGGSPTEVKPDGVEIAEFVLHPTERIMRFEEKAGFSPWKETTPTFMPQGTDAIPTEGVVDLTTKMSADGTLNWTVPEGNWQIIRFGCVVSNFGKFPTFDVEGPSV